jgi:hypothetical protein
MIYPFLARDLGKVNCLDVNVLFIERLECSEGGVYILMFLLLLLLLISIREEENGPSE